MNKKKILVLGNDPQVNRIKFSLLDPAIETLGVNRIFLAHAPTYFFFHDPEIAKELEAQPEYLDKLKDDSKIFSSDWLTRAKSKAPQWTTVLSRSHTHKYSFPDSVTTAIRLISDKFIDHTKYVFYIGAVSLTWKNPSHFWKELNYPALNTFDNTWYDPRFLRVIENFKSLKNSRFEMVSVTPDSQLNKYLRYESIENLYVKEKY
jgi:hypothetical protein